MEEFKITYKIGDKIEIRHIDASRFEMGYNGIDGFICFYNRDEKKSTDYFILAINSDVLISIEQVKID